jgi:putative oxidoreductase
MSATGLLVLRWALAVVSFAHGAHILFGWFGGLGTGLGPGGLTDSAARFGEMGLPGSAAAVAAGLAQLVGGTLLAIGFLTRISAIALAAITSLLAWKSEWAWGFFLNWTMDAGRGHGLEFSVLLIAGYACIALTGGGEFSIDGRKARRATSVAAGRARLRRT